jgi:hypothetical protein
MIAFDLVCTSNDHRFEGWFASSAEYDRQLEANLLCCPVCGSAAVSKAVMAPNIGRKGNQQTASAAKREEDQSIAVSNQPEMPVQIAKAIAELSKLQSKMLENSAWVGDKFAEEARSIHYGEQPERIIHGEATPQQAQALFDEGVSVAPLPLPFVPPEAKN